MYPSIYYLILQKYCLLLKLSKSDSVPYPWYSYPTITLTETKEGLRIESLHHEEKERAESFGCSRPIERRTGVAAEGKAKSRLPKMMPLAGTQLFSYKCIFFFLIFFPPQLFFFHTFKGYRRFAGRTGQRRAHHGNQQNCRSLDEEGADEIERQGELVYSLNFFQPLPSLFPLLLSPPTPTISPCHPSSTRIALLAVGPTTLPLFMYRWRLI